MSDAKHAASSPSGQMPAVAGYRKKLESIEDAQMAAIKTLNRRIEKQHARAMSSRASSSAPEAGEGCGEAGAAATIPSPPPRAADPRREGDSEIPVDVVELEGPDDAAEIE